MAALWATGAHVVYAPCKTENAFSRLKSTTGPRALLVLRKVFSHGITTGKGHVSISSYSCTLVLVCAQRCIRSVVLYKAPFASLRDGAAGQQCCAT